MIRYRCPASHGEPPIGAIVMGDGARVRRAYLVMRAVRCRGTPALGSVTWRLTVERMSAAAGRYHIECGAPHWTIVWDSRAPRGPSGPGTARRGAFDTPPA